MLRRAVRRLARILITAIVIVLILIGVSLTIIETAWAKNRIRDLMVRQANEYLNATLTIGSLSGSLLRGLQLGHIELSRDGHPLIAIDEIALSYSIRELIESGTVIRRIRLTRPRFVVTRQSDGRWDLAAIVKREEREGRQTGPSRPIVIQRIEIVDGRVQFNNPLDFGATHAPTDFDRLNAVFAYAYFPVRWRLDFDNLSFIGRAPDLTMTTLTGALGNGPGGWFFDQLAIHTPQSAYNVSGRVVRGDQPTALDLTVHADRLAFQEWAGVLHGLRNIAVTSSFEVALKGPLAQVGTDIKLAGDGGSVDGHLTLDTTVPGWRAAGAVQVGRIDLARWLNSPERPSDITGRVSFDLALELGRRFPRGVYAFEGPHAMYMHYAADDVRARGQITAGEVLVQSATARAYGAGVTAADGSIGIDSPFPYRFQGHVAQIDLRNLPEAIPVPHVESVLSFTYDVTGTFSQPFIVGRARFEPSTFLGAQVGAGTAGTIDTQQQPPRYSGEGDLANVDLGRFGQGLDIGWLRDPRYAGSVAGHFKADGTIDDAPALTANASGRLSRATLFTGTLQDADVQMTIARGTLQASYTGAFTGIDPAIPFADERWQAKLTGTGTMTTTVHDLLIRDATLDDYDMAGTLALRGSTVHEIPFDRAQIEATLRNSMLSIARLEAAGPAVEGRGSGTIAFDDSRPSAFDYDLTRADLAQVRQLTGIAASGAMATKGRLSGPSSALRLNGDGSIAELDAFSVHALTVNGKYDATIPDGDANRVSATIDGGAAFLTIGGQQVREVTGKAAVAPQGSAQKLSVDLQVTQAEQRRGSIAGSALLHRSDRAIDLETLTINLGTAPWRLQRGDRTATIHWDDHGVAITPVVFVGASNDERIALSGTWRDDGSGALRMTATHVSLESLQRAFERPTRYGGVLDADATLRGTRAHPIVSGTIAVTGGRVERVNYQRLAGRIDLADRVFSVDLRLDQAPGVFVTAAGTIPLAFVDSSLPPLPMNVQIRSSGVNLGLIEGVTAVVRNVSGEIQLDVRAVGTSSDPHFEGTINIDRAAFLVATTGVSYKNARLALRLSPERVLVDSFHLEDGNGRPLELRGSLGTHELRVGALEIDITAQRFEILRNEFGRLQVDAHLQLVGQFESPRLTGEITIAAGELRVDEILLRTAFGPGSTRETAIVTTADPLATALNPWQQLGLNLTVHVPNTLRLVGDNVVLKPGTPIGLGDVNVRVAGDQYFYKDPGQPFYVTGSFDTASGSYVFQGRRFAVDPASSIIFRGDVSPELYFGVTRTIQGVDTRVVLTGPLPSPELRLSSVPPLPEADILSLIVFNTATSQLTAEQQQNLAVRVYSLAAGFVVAPLMQELSNLIGVQVLVEPGDAVDNGPKVGVERELAPGLVARFSRQFGSEPYDEATIDYYLSKILRLRATFSDSQTLTSRSPFRRVERAGIDLLFFFSF